MSLRADPDDDAGSLLCAPDGQVLARLTLRDDDGEQVAARVQPVVRPLVAVVAQARQDLAGLRLDTDDDDLASALGSGPAHVATGVHDSAARPRRPARAGGFAGRVVVASAGLG